MLIFIIIQIFLLVFMGKKVGRGEFLYLTPSLPCKFSIERKALANRIFFLGFCPVSDYFLTDFEIPDFANAIGNLIFESCPRQSIKFNLYFQYFLFHFRNHFLF